MLALPAQLLKSLARSVREKNLSRTRDVQTAVLCNNIVNIPYAPAGFTATVSFISPERNAVIALGY